ncbi:phage tail length tape measure family protein [Massilia sp. NP310]|uniref:phage tail length tape measure family protein n=1 Tax=Massilia sp. NP310 TaxID=2861282 RepID=UPI001C62A9DF|nr:phage tail length tape measure family protein [Massilia sp. NP310]QYG01885.1 phage tail length tape measure family protein [Massilia sp. NP310]
MTDIVNNATIKVTADASGVEAGLRPAVEAANRTGQAIAQTGQRAAGAARAVESAQRNIIASIQRTTMAMEAGGRATSNYYEMQARHRGVDPASLDPYLSKLRAVEAAQRQSTDAAKAQAAAEREVAQAQSAKDNLLASLREQIALFGKSADEVQRYRAAQVGASSAADPLIAQLRALRVAQEQAAEAARLEAQAQREAAQAKASRESFVAGLREQIALHGKSADEVLRYRAAQAGASQESSMLILQLQNMRVAQEQVEAAARAAAVAQREAALADTARNSYLAGLREQIALFGLSTDEVNRYRAAQLGAATAAEPLLAQLRDLRLAQEQQTYATRMEAQAQRELAQVQASRGSFIKGLEQQVSAIGKTRTEMLELQAAQLGVTNQAKPLIDQLRAQEQAFGNGGMSAAAMNAALRNVPAQITDIVVSLQGGQAPLTVFLQQGGQLKDMFGGVGAAAKALGGALLNMINPYTVAVAAIGVGTFAFKAGHDEAIRYSRALALTGNISGTTALQMADMAHSIGEVSGSQRVAAAALTVLAGTGAIARENLQWFGTVAVDAQHVLGKSVEDTAKEFAELGKNPLTALQSIADKYHFVTAETYAQVRALQEQGRMLEAANVAQRAYADGINGQRQKVLDSLTDWERGWLRIQKAASGAVDSVIDFVGGREEGGQQKIAALLDAREAIEKRMERLVESGKKRKGDDYDPTQDMDFLGAEAQLDLNKRQINAIRDKGKASKDAAAREAEGIRADELRNKWLGERNILLTRQELLTKELNAAETEGKLNGLSVEEIQDRQAVVRRKYNDVFLAGIDASMTALRNRGELEDVLAQRALAQIQAQRAAGEITEDEALRQVASQELASIDRQRQGLQEQLSLTRQKIGSQRDQIDLQGKLDKLSEQRFSREKQLENDLAATQRSRSQASMDLYMQGVEAANAELVGLEDQVKAQRLANEEIGLSKEAVAVLRAERLLEAAARKEQTAAEIEAKQAGSATAEIYRQQAAALRNLALERQQGVVKDGIAEANQKAQESLKDFLDPTKAQTFGEALREAFGTAGDSISKMTSTLDAFGKRQAKISEERANADMLLRNGKISEIKHLEYVDQLNRESTKNHLASYGSMTSAAAGFFGEQSRGYKALQTASQVFHAAELAMTLAELVPKGISAVLGQGQGDPYTAFAGWQPWRAIVTGLGVAIGACRAAAFRCRSSGRKSRAPERCSARTPSRKSIARSLEAIRVPRSRAWASATAC